MANYEPRYKYNLLLFKITVCNTNYNKYLTYSPASKRKHKKIILKKINLIKMPLFLLLIKYMYYLYYHN